MAKLPKNLDEMTADELQQFCISDGICILLNPCGDADAHWCVSDEHGHKEGMGASYLKGALGFGATVTEAYMDHKIRKAGFKVF